jgi:hypothetical protein
VSNGLISHFIWGYLFSSSCKKRKKIFTSNMPLSHNMIHIVIPVLQPLASTPKSVCRSLRRIKHIPISKPLWWIMVQRTVLPNSSNLSFRKLLCSKGDESMWWTAATNVGVRYALAKWRRLCAYLEQRFNCSI